MVSNRLKELLDPNLRISRPSLQSVSPQGLLRVLATQSEAVFFGMEYPCDSESGSSNPKVVDNVK